MNRRPHPPPDAAELRRLALLAVQQPPSGGEPSPSELWRGLLRGSHERVAHFPDGVGCLLVIRRIAGGARPERALCRRERQVVELAALGLSVTAVASACSLSKASVSQWLCSALPKLDCKNRLELVRIYGPLVEVLDR